MFDDESSLRSVEVGGFSSLWTARPALLLAASRFRASHALYSSLRLGESCIRATFRVEYAKYCANTAPAVIDVGPSTLCGCGVGFGPARTCSPVMVMRLLAVGPQEQVGIAAARWKVPPATARRPKGDKRLWARLSIWLKKRNQSIHHGRGLPHRGWR